MPPKRDISHLEQEKQLKVEHVRELKRKTAQRNRDNEKMRRELKTAGPSPGPISTTTAGPRKHTPGPSFAVQPIPTLPGQSFFQPTFSLPETSFSDQPLPDVPPQSFPGLSQPFQPTLNVPWRNPAQSALASPVVQPFPSSCFNLQQVPNIPGWSIGVQQTPNAPGLIISVQPTIDSTVQPTPNKRGPSELPQELMAVSPTPPVENTPPGTPSYASIATNTTPPPSFRYASVATNTEAASTDAPVIKDLTCLEGAAFQKESPIVEWAGGYKTRLPWISAPDDPKKNLLETDLNHVKALAGDARLARESGWVVYIKYGDFETEWDLGVRIKKEISQGNPVILEGCPFTPVKLEAEDLKKKLLLYENRLVEAHDTLLRVENPSNPHKAMSLGDFCKGVEDDSRIQCVLDCPSTDRAKPSFIKYVDDGMSTLGVLHMEYSDRHFIPIDMLNSSSWYLLHQPLYHTYAHHDADGYGTWTQVLSGHKFWTFIRHKGIKKDCPDRRVYFEAYDNYATAKFTDEGFYGRESDRFVVHAAAGDVIIQPPGTTHEVYTPTPSVTLGGHYLTYGSMHLTEVSRAYDFKTKKLLTNQEHVSIKPLLSMMVAALPSLPTSIHPRKSLFALLRMVRAPSHYQRKNLAEPDKEDETTQERRELSDVEYAKTLCISLQKDMKIKDTVWHYFPKIATQNRGDFIFDGSNWQDPGEDVEIPRALFGRVPQRVA